MALRSQRRQSARFPTAGKHCKENGILTRTDHGRTGCPTCPPCPSLPPHRRNSRHSPPTCAVGIPPPRLEFHDPEGQLAPGQQGRFAFEARRETRNLFSIPPDFRAIKERTYYQRAALVRRRARR
jgi:hypothetical protein